MTDVQQTARSQEEGERGRGRESEGAIERGSRALGSFRLRIVSSSTQKAPALERKASQGQVCLCVCARVCARLQSACVRLPVFANLLKIGEKETKDGFYFQTFKML